MTREELDAQYDTSRPLPPGAVPAYLERFAAESARARETCTFETLRYGSHDRETFDFFPSGCPGAPLFVWVHGGYWRRTSKDESSLVAPALVRAGANVAVLNYPLAPGPTLDDIVASVRAGFVAATERARRAAGDADRTSVGGHSVGAQLAGMIASAFPVRGMFALSGLYDLEPLRHSHINEWIALDAATAARNAPLLHRPLGTPALVIATGGREQSEFHRQQRDYEDAWRAWGAAARAIPAPEHDHFSIVLELMDDTSPLTRALRDMVFERPVPTPIEPERGSRTAN
jgi:arylformamidase